MTIKEVGADQYSVDLKKKLTNWWGVKLESVAGRTVRLTFTGIPAKYWSAIRPVYVEGGNLSDPQLYEPDDRGERWKFVDDASVHGGSSITFTQKFSGNNIFVALRVPYTLGYHEKRLASVSKLAGVEVLTVGQSLKGLPLKIVKIGAGNEAAEKKNPCVVVYAREHCDEPDSSWAVDGALRFLASDSLEAQELRNRCTFLLIPMLDPDGFLDGRHGSIYRSFEPTRPTQESLAYAGWFARWSDSGGRLDVVLNLHNPEPREYPHVMAKFMEGKDGRLPEIRALHETIVSRFDKEITHRTIGVPEWYSFRLGGWLAYYFGALPILYEVNSQSPTRRLTLTELRDLGKQLVVGAAQHLESPQGQILRGDVERVRATRLQALSRLTSESGENAFQREQRIRQSIRLAVSTPIKPLTRQVPLFQENRHEQTR